MNTLKREYTNGERKISLTFDYEGEEITEATLKALDKTLNNLSDYESTSLVSSIRAILHNYKENLLSIKVKSRDFSCEIVYENGVLKLFTKKETIDVDCGVETKYKDKSYFDIRITGEDIDNILSKTEKINGKEREISVHDFYLRLIKKEIRELKSMEYGLSRYANLAAYYKLFYQSDADISAKDAEDKLQIAIYLLKKFGLLDIDYEFTSNQIGYEYFNMSFDQAYLPRADEVKMAKEMMAYVKDINVSDIEIPNKEKILAMSDLIRETTAFETEKIVELAIVLHVHDQLKTAKIEEEEKGRKVAMDEALNMEKRLNEVYKKDSIISVKKLLNRINPDLMQ